MDVWFIRLAVQQDYATAMAIELTNQRTNRVYGINS
jgi:hypothetical protein